MLDALTCVLLPRLLLHPRGLPQPTEFPRILIALDGEISRRGMERLVLASEADRIVGGAAVPVLIGPVRHR